MIFDELFINIETGEIALSGEAIKDFYKDHNGLEDWHSVWKFYKTASVCLDKPSFEKILSN